MSIESVIYGVVGIALGFGAAVLIYVVGHEKKEFRASLRHQFNEIFPDGNVTAKIFKLRRSLQSVYDLLNSSRSTPIRPIDAPPFEMPVMVADAHKELDEAIAVAYYSSRGKDVEVAMRIPLDASSGELSQIA